MFLFHPVPETSHSCPDCALPLQSQGWKIPGVRVMADLVCETCGKEFYGDLPVGHGLHYPMLLDKKTGHVHDKYGVSWFAQSLERSYFEKAESSISMEVEQFRLLKNIIIVNCLDSYYGHCLLKLLNVQYYLENYDGCDVVVLVPRFLRWLVPEGVAAIWAIDLSLAEAQGWYESLDLEIKRILAPYEKASVSIGFSHPHMDDFNIVNFSRVNPFELNGWQEKISQPVVSFIWRDNRCWVGNRRDKNFLQKLRDKLKPETVQQVQISTITEFANQLRSRHPDVQFAVVGLGDLGGFPEWIKDMRMRRLTEQDEKEWCKQYAKSHVVVGVHGSNMLLPSAHAGATVELVPSARWGNLVQDVLPRDRDVRFNLFTQRFVPEESSPETLARCVSSLFTSGRGMMVNFTKPYVDHDKVSRNPSMVAKARFE